MNRVMQVALVKLVVVFLLFITAVSALFSGLSLVLHPDGSKLGLDVSLLAGTGFADYLAPGAILFAAIGLLSLFSAIYAAINGRYYTLMLLLTGLMLTGWIMSEAFLLKMLNLLQVIFAALGILLAGAALWLRKNLPGPDQ